MDKLEKAERLRKSAQVSYEEAMEALEKSGWDLLDAMVLLEKEGKTAAPDQGLYSTSYREQKEYIDVPEEVAQQKRTAPTFRRSLASLFHTLFRFLLHTSLRMTRRGKSIFRLPVWILVPVVFIFWKAAVPVFAASLLLGFRFSFEGPEDTDAANNILSQAGDLADEFRKDVRSGLNPGRKKKGGDT